MEGFRRAKPTLDSESTSRTVDESPGDVTIATYEATAQAYRDLDFRGPKMLGFLDRLAELVPQGNVLELGSGPGFDASYLEQRGLRVTRTDATRAFVEMMRTDGHEARVLDVRSDDLGGPYDAVLANAVLLHLTRAEFCDVLGRAARAVAGGGLIAMTLKEGDGETWSSARLGLPRHFTYWREPEVRSALKLAGWSSLSFEHMPGRNDTWLMVVASRGAR